VGHALIHLQFRFDAGLTQLAVCQDGKAQEQIAVPLVRIAGGKPWKSP
jgi:hypothetical protein